jgi:hypothetical protein
LDFPKFEGKEDPLTWLNRCEQFFGGQRTDEAFKIWLAAYHMVGVAQEWYMQLERDEGMPSWLRFKEPMLWATNPKQSLGEIARMRSGEISVPSCSQQPPFDKAAGSTVYVRTY